MLLLEMMFILMLMVHIISAYICSDFEVNSMRPLLGQLLTKLTLSHSAFDKAASGDQIGVSIIGDECGLKLAGQQDEGLAMTKILTHFSHADSSPTPSSMALTKLSLNHIFLLTDTSNEEKLRVEMIQANNYFNPRASYTFIMPDAQIGLAKTISFHTTLGKAKTVIFVWPDSDRKKWLFLVPNRHTPLPPPNHEELEIYKVVNIGEDLDEDFKLYPPMVENLKGRTLRVTGIDYSPHVAARTNADGTKEWFGFEVQMIEALSDAANFKSSFRPTTDGVLWGEFNGTSFNGLLGDLQQGHTDVGIANLYVRTDSSQYVDFSDPFNYDAYCFLVPMPKPGVNWLILFEPMAFTVWVGFVASILACSIFLSLIVYLFGEKYSMMSYSYVQLSMIGWWFAEPYQFESNVRTVRILLGPFMIAFSVLIMGYNGILISFLTIDVKPKLMETIDELVDIRMPLGNYKYSLNMTKFFSRNADPRIRSLANKYEPYDTYDEGIAIGSQGEIIMMESNILLFYLRSQMSDRKTGKPINYIMPDCWRFMYPVSYGMQKHSIFKHALDSKILFIREGGFVNKWFNDELSGLAINEKKELRDGKLTMTAMRVPFIFLIMCILIVFVAWGGEWMWYRRSQIKARKSKLRWSLPKITISGRRRSNRNDSLYLSKVRASYQRSDNNGNV